MTSSATSGAIQRNLRRRRPRPPGGPRLRPAAATAAGPAVARNRRRHRRRSRGRTAPGLRTRPRTRACGRRRLAPGRVGVTVLVVVAHRLARRVTGLRRCNRRRRWSRRGPGTGRGATARVAVRPARVTGRGGLGGRPAGRGRGRGGAGSGATASRRASRGSGRREPDPGLVVQRLRGLRLGRGGWNTRGSCWSGRPAACRSRLTRSFRSGRCARTSWPGGPAGGAFGVQGGLQQDGGGRGVDDLAAGAGVLAAAAQRVVRLGGGEPLVDQPDRDRARAVRPGPRRTPGHRPRRHLPGRTATWAVRR